MSARTIIESQRFYDPRSLWLHGSRSEFEQFKLGGKSGWDAGGIFLVKDTKAQEAYARTYGEKLYRCRVRLTPDQVFELPVPDHIDRVAAVNTDDAIGNDFLRSAFESQRYGHADWASLDQEVLELAGFKGVILAERPKGFNNYAEDILSLCVFDPGVIEIVGRVTESRQPEPHWLLTVQRPQGDVPGYAQIDKIDPTGDSRESLSLEAFAAEGYQVPDVSRLATGQYRLGQFRTESRARALIEAQAFRDWFAGSKVVDAQGRPLRVYHGTNQAFKRFTHARKGDATRAISAKDGFFFTDSPEVAEEYADYAARQVVANVAAHEKTVARLKAETDRLEQVARLTRRPEDWAAFEQSQAAWEDTEIGAVQAEPEGQNIVPVYLRMVRPYEPAERATSSGKIAEFIRDAKRTGYDGVILRDIRDSPGNRSSSTQYIVFKTSQIRSAIGALGEAEVKPPRRWLVTIPTAGNTPWRKVAVTATSEEAAWYQAYGEPARNFRLSRSRYGDTRVVVLKKRPSNGIVGYIDPILPEA